MTAAESPDPVFSSRALVRHGEHGTFQVEVPCDDATGGVLRFYVAHDGDVHVSLRYDMGQPNALDGLDGPYGVPVHMVHVRLRSGLGGGSNPTLFLAVATALRALAATPTSTPARAVAAPRSAPPAGATTRVDLDALTASSVRVLHRRAMRAMDQCEDAERRGDLVAARTAALTALDGEMQALTRFMAGGGTGPTGAVLAGSVQGIAATLRALLATLAEGAPR